jgi:hypothetical protein
MARGPHGQKCSEVVGSVVHDDDHGERLVAEGR